MKHNNWPISNQIKNNSCRNVFSGQLDCVVVGQMSGIIKLYFASVPMSRPAAITRPEPAAAREWSTHRLWPLPFSILFLWPFITSII